MLEGSIVTVQAKGGGAVDIPPPVESTPRGGQRVPHIASARKLNLILFYKLVINFVFVFSQT